jgi:hypothetical protein
MERHLRKRANQGLATTTSRITRTSREEVGTCRLTGVPSETALIPGFLTFAHRFFAAFTIAALPAADRARFLRDTS